MNRIEKLLEFLKATPGDSFLNHALALEYIKAGDDPSARKLFESLLEKDPAYVGSYYHLGKLLERAGEPGRAVEVYERGMSKARESGDMHSYNELQGARDELQD